MIARERLLMLLGAVLLSLVARVLLLAHQAGDFDEFQLLHGAWNAAHGLLPYRDFWENHGPAPYYLLAPLFWGGHDDAVFFAGRAVAAACGVGALALTYRLARLFVARPAAVAAVAMLAWTPIFAVKTIETRPDAFLLLLWLGAVVAYLGGPGARRAVVAGLVLGVEVWVSPKALFGLVALTLGALAQGVASHQARRGLRDAVLIGLGFLGPVALLALVFLGLGALGPLWRWMILYNFSVPALLGRPIPDLLLPSMLALDAFGLAGIVLQAARPVDGRRVALATAALVLLVIYLFIMPTPYLHSVLPALPLVCVLAATVLERSARRLVWLVAFAGTVVVPMVALVHSGKLWQRDARLDAQLDIGAYVRAHLAPDAPYYGPAAYPITRRSVWFFHVVAGEVAEALARGRYPPPDIPPLAQVLRHNDCPMLVSGTNWNRSRTPDVARLIARSYRVAYQRKVDVLEYTVWTADGGCRR